MKNMNGKFFFMFRIIFFNICFCFFGHPDLIKELSLSEMKIYGDEKLFRFICFGRQI